MGAEQNYQGRDARVMFEILGTSKPNDTPSPLE